MRKKTGNLFAEADADLSVSQAAAAAPATEKLTLPIPDASVEYYSALLEPEKAEEVLAELIATLAWREETITVFGKTYNQPRLFAWYGDADAHYSYSGLNLEPLPWTALLSELRHKVEDRCDGRFNSVLVNYYRDQRDSMGMHADDEPELGSQPLIASLSVGEQRVFRLKHKRRGDLKLVKLPLESGSLLVMRGDTQDNWKHGIGKQTAACGPRVNLTFRRIRPGG